MRDDLNSPQALAVAWEVARGRDELSAADRRVLLLEFDRIRKALADYAYSWRGRSLALSLCPAEDLELASQAHDRGASPQAGSDQRVTSDHWRGIGRVAAEIDLLLVDDLAVRHAEG